jgi:hypothetical protein
VSYDRDIYDYDGQSRWDVWIDQRRPVVQWLIFLTPWALLTTATLALAALRGLA